MASSIGSKLKLSVFGQSHSPAIGCVVEGLPSGFAVDEAALDAFMARRAPGKNALSTPRKEADKPRIISGLNAYGSTCGAPLAIVIENTNTRSGDYAAISTVPRPGHADFSAWAKWHGNQDIPGGGHFSGRLTAPLCAAGGIALQMLAEQGILVRAHVQSIADVEDERFSLDDNELFERQFASLAEPGELPVIDEAAATRMQDAVLAAKAELDSVGGVVECAVSGMPAGVGEPMFDGLDSLLARALFGIPAVKGVEVGAGFAATRMRGSKNNDPYGVKDGACAPLSNNAGGVLGGISTGAPIVCRIAIKPISSIGAEQDSVDLASGEAVKLTVGGRHDPCACIRAVPVVEAVVALTLLDALLSYPAENAPLSAEK